MGKYYLNKMKLVVYIIYATILMQLLAFGLASTNVEVVSRRGADKTEDGDAYMGDISEDKDGYEGPEEGKDTTQDADGLDEDEEEDEEFIKAIMGGIKKLGANLKKLSLGDMKKRLAEIKSKMAKLSGKKLAEMKALLKSAAAEAGKRFPKIKFGKFREEYEEEFIGKLFGKLGGLFNQAWKKMSSVDYKKHLKELRAKIVKAGKGASAAMKKKFNDLGAGAGKLFKNISMPDIAMLMRVEEDEDEEIFSAIFGKAEEMVNKLENMSAGDLKKKLAALTKDMGKLAGKKLAEAKAYAKKAYAAAKKRFPKVKWARVSEEVEEEIFGKLLGKVKGLFNQAWNKMSKADYRKHLLELKAKLTSAGSKATAEMKKRFNQLRAGAGKMFKGVLQTPEWAALALM